MNIFYKLLIIAVLQVGLSSCVQHDEKFVIDLINGHSSTEDAKIFEGANRVMYVTDTTALIVWSSSSLVSSYIIYEMSDLQNPIVLGIASSSAATFKLTNLQPNTLYNIVVRAEYSPTISIFVQDDNTDLITFTTNKAPNVPTAVTLTWPSYDYGVEDSPIIRIHGTKKNDKIKIYTDSTCTTKIAEILASPNTEFSDVQLFNLALGRYNFYARLANSQYESDCSEYTTSYYVSECPNNYVKILSEAAFGINTPFCVAKYEMKCNDASGLYCEGSLPQSNPANQPWRNITHNEAKAACQSLGPNYHLITNNEWMAMAKQIENNEFNWSGFKKADFTLNSPNYNPNATLNRGHSNNYPSSYLSASTDDNNACYGLTGITLEQCNSLQWHINKRTHNTADDEIIWDIAGNIWEWVDFSTNDKPAPEWKWKEVNLVNGTVALPNANFKSQMTQLNAQVNGIGAYFATDNSYTSYMRRGGNKDHGVGAGVYALVLREGPEEMSADIGFRCSYTITP